MAENGTSAACPKLMATTSHGIFQGDNPIDFSLSLLIVQVVLVLAVTRILGVLLRPLRQPRVIAEIIGGVLLGPSALGKNNEYMAKLFPKQSVTILQTFANMGLMFFLFMVGLELDLASLKRTGKQAMAISIAGISVPFAAGIGVSFVLHNTINPDAKFVPFLVFMGVALSITAFPVLARILAERRLLTTDVGKMAIAAAAANDVVAWIFLALAVALSGTGRSPAVAAWILLCGVAFVLAMFLFVKPLMTWLASRSPDDQPVRELYVCIALGGVLVSGFTTDFIGIHGIFGAFVFGLIIPEGHFAQALIEKIEDFVNILMLPLYFAASGLQTNIGSISGAQSFGLLILVIVTACGGKILGTLAVSMAYGEKFKKALTLGFLMNTKGLVELIVLNIGKERKVLNDEMFAIMVLMALFTTFITTPVVMALYKPARDQVPYKRRSLYNTARGAASGAVAALTTAELRVVACVHGMRNVPSIMNLMEAMRGTNKREALRLYIVHLVELTERSSAIMMVQRVRRDGLPFSSRPSVAIVDGIGVAFGAFAQLNRVAVRSLTAISSFSEMHDDVCATAASKRAALVVLPFHRTARAAGDDSTSPGFQGVNQRVMLHAPCSVALLVDRGDAAQQQVSSHHVDNMVAVAFFGGPDDREAAALGLRMAEHPGIKLTLLRFSYVAPPQEENVHVAVAIAVEEHHLGSGRWSGSGDFLPRMSSVETAYHLAGTDAAAEAKEDDECLAAVRRAAEAAAAEAEADSAPAVTVEEVPYDDPVEAILALARRNEHGLIIVGRGRRPAAAVAAVSKRQQPTYAELGPIGDALVAAEQQSSGSPAAIRASVLVVQQYDQLLVPGRTALPQPSVSPKVSHVATP